jgi:hypothetical protein
MGFIRKHLSAGGLHKTVKHSLLRVQFQALDHFRLEVGG